MKPGQLCAGIGIAVAVPLLIKSPGKLAAFGCFTAAAWYYLKPHKVVVSEEELSPTRKSICTDRFAESKVPEDIDTIVIGSGMSGMTCAALLARTGQRVLVLEQHDRTGGGSHEYELGKEGWHFDAGLHYTVPESGLLLQLCTGTKEIPVPMDLLGEPPGPDGSMTFERVYVGDDPVFEVQVHQKHMAELRRRFPDCQADIDRYIREADEAVDTVPMFVASKLMPFSWQRFLAPVLLRRWRRDAGRTVQDALESITKNKKLQAYLASLWLDTGCPPDQCCWFLGAAVFWGLPQKGGAYPRGGPQRMSQCLVPVVERAGGRVLVRSNVEEVVIEGGRAVGVKVQGMKRMIAAKRVVSSCGFKNTYTKLIPKKTTESLGLPTSLPISDSHGFVLVNVGFKGSAQELGFTNVNHWSIPVDKTTGSMFESLKRHWSDPTDRENMPMMFTFPSMKEHSSQRGTKHTLQVLVLAAPSKFAAWVGSDPSKRPAEYEAYKKLFSDAVLERTAELFPGTVGKIAFVDVCSPLTIEHYLKTPSGGAGGLDMVPRRFTDLDIQEALETRSRIPGLWLTGQDTLLLGIPLVQLSGMITAFRISGLLKSVRLILTNLLFSLPPVKIA